MSTDAYNSLKTSVSNGKSAVASAITDKGVSTSATAEFSTMASNIRAISTPSGTATIIFNFPNVSTTIPAKSEGSAGNSGTLATINGVYWTKYFSTYKTLLVSIDEKLYFRNASGWLAVGNMQNISITFTEGGTYICYAF